MLHTAKPRFPAPFLQGGCRKAVRGVCAGCSGSEDMGSVFVLLDRPGTCSCTATTQSDVLIDSAGRNFIIISLWTKFAKLKTQQMTGLLRFFFPLLPSIVCLFVFVLVLVFLFLFLFFFFLLFFSLLFLSDTLYAERLRQRGTWTNWLTDWTRQHTGNCLSSKNI